MTSSEGDTWHTGLYTFELIRGVAMSNAMTLGLHAPVQQWSTRLKLVESCDWAASVRTFGSTVCLKHSLESETYLISLLALPVGAQSYTRFCNFERSPYIYS
jgi:hypothetical protein